MSRLKIQLKVLMPFATFIDISKIVSMVAETVQGSLGILPNRLDCVAILRAGILSYTSVADGEQFIALDEGVLVKTGDKVTVSTRRAIGGTDLKTLHQLVVEEFQVQDEQEKNWHATMLKLETGFLRRFANFNQ